MSISQTEQEAPGRKSIDQAILLTIFFLLNALYFSLIFGNFDNPSCCDASHYLEGSSLLFSDGLLFDHAYSGYRSYLNYVLTGVVEAAGKPIRALLGMPAKATISYALGAIVIYVATAICLVRKFHGSRGFNAIFGAVYLSPLSLAYLIYPLQESQIVLVLAPFTVAIVVSLMADQWERSVVLLWVFAALVWMVKSAFLLVALPLVGLAVYLAYWWLARRWIITATGVLLAAAIVLPQSYIALEKHGTTYPYPDNTVLKQQLTWGYTAWHYETVYDTSGDGDVKWKGDFAANAYNPVKSPNEYVARLLDNPKEVISTWIGHIFSAFNYSHLKVYITDTRAGFSNFNVLVGMVIFLGFSTWISAVIRGPYLARDFFSDSIMIGSALAFPLIAVESRFGYLAATMLLYRALLWSTAPISRGRRQQDVGCAALFGLLFAFAMTLVDTAS